MYLLEVRFPELGWVWVTVGGSKSGFEATAGVIIITTRRMALTYDCLISHKAETVVC